MLTRWTKSTMLLLMGVALMYGQNVTILAIKGDVQVEQAGGWQKATAGMKLSESQKIKLGAQSYAALVSSTNKTRELRQPGVYTLSQLFAQATEDNAYASRYTGYLTNQAIASGGGRASGKTLGAVTRSTMAPTPRVPAQTAFYPDRILLSWERVPNPEGYIIEILDEAGQVVYNTQVPPDKNFVEINSENKFKSGVCYYWHVSTRRHASLRSTNLCFRLLTPEQVANLRKEEESLRRSLDLNTALGQAILGGFYEMNGMYAYALDAYTQATNLEPGTDGYIALRDGLIDRVVRQPVSE
ncbi:MAG: hypothetical protein NZ580_02380 [Bacteroidia bacterium]|nr:hypothetical protein [Bacteroidia bacterium]MDW8235667.1 hypothetical protein [Bacteroidia bacterium]